MDNNNVHWTRTKSLNSQASLESHGGNINSAKEESFFFTGDVNADAFLDEGNIVLRSLSGTQPNTPVSIDNLPNSHTVEQLEGSSKKDDQGTARLWLHGSYLRYDRRLPNDETLYHTDTSSGHDKGIFKLSIDGSSVIHLDHNSRAQLQLASHTVYSDRYVDGHFEFEQSDVQIDDLMGGNELCVTSGSNEQIFFLQGGDTMPSSPLPRHGATMEDREVDTTKSSTLARSHSVQILPIVYVQTAKLTTLYICYHWEQTSFSMRSIGPVPLPCFLDCKVPTEDEFVVYILCAQDDFDAPDFLGEHAWARFDDWLVLNSSTTFLRWFKSGSDMRWASCEYSYRAFVFDGNIDSITGTLLVMSDVGSVVPILQLKFDSAQPAEEANQSDSLGDRHPKPRPTPDEPEHIGKKRKRT